MSADDLRSAVWAASALRVAVERGVLAAILGGARDVAALARETSIAPAALARLVDVLVAHGILASGPSDGVALTKDGEALAAQGIGVALELTAAFGQARAFVDDSRRGDLDGGWHHADPEVIRAQGQLSERTMACVLPKMMEAIPSLERLAKPGAAFLDVGLGAAGGTIAICRKFPTLRAVGLEPLPLARQEARAAIEAARLSDRIEVRAQRIEEVREENTFDVVYVASMFMPVKALEQGLPKVLRALAPGGVILLGAWARPTDPREASTSALRRHMWGGGVLQPAEMIKLMNAAGFKDVKEAPPGGDMAPLYAFKA
jgi:SAM-dependent methyltransferase